MASNFEFVPDRKAWSSIRRDTLFAERRIEEDPAGACSKARRVLERVVVYLYDNELDVSPQGNLFRNINHDTFRKWVKESDNAGSYLYNDFHRIRQSGNDGTHPQENEVKPAAACRTVGALQRVLWWFVQRYAPADAVGERPPFEPPDRKEATEALPEPDEGEEDKTTRASREEELQGRSTEELATLIKGETTESGNVEIATAILLHRIYHLNDELIATLR